MHKTILMIVDGAPSDRAMVEYVKPFAKLLQSRLILVHVENGAGHGHGREVHYPGATDAVEYLKGMQKEFRSAGVPVELVLSYGEPVMEIKKQVQKRTCDLVVMSAKERKSVSDMFFGTILECVQNAINVPALLIK